MSNRANHGHGESEEMAFEDYKREVVIADQERAHQAWKLAMHELKPEPKDTATQAGMLRWSKAVNKRARVIFERLQ